MVTWRDLTEQRPELAEAGRTLLYQYGVGLGFLATIRPDTGPRLHPICPILHEVRLLAFIIPSPKLNDLRRDGRYARCTASRQRTTKTPSTPPAGPEFSTTNNSAPMWLDSSPTSGPRTPSHRPLTTTYSSSSTSTITFAAPLPHRSPATGWWELAAGVAACSGPFAGRACQASLPSGGEPGGARRLQRPGDDPPGTRRSARRPDPPPQPDGGL